MAGNNLKLLTLASFFILLVPESYGKSSKQGGNGYVKGVRFENVEMHDVANPIIIDQFYCDSPSTCQNQVSFFFTKPLTQETTRIFNHF